MQTACKSDSYLWSYCDFMFSKWLPIGAAILKLILNLKIIKLNLFLKSMHTRTHLTNVLFVYYANNHFLWLFYGFCIFIRHYWKTKINIHCELVTSQPHWFLVPSLTFLNFQSSITSLFIVSLVLEILWFWLGLTISDPFPLINFKEQKP